MNMRGSSKIGKGLTNRPGSCVIAPPHEKSEAMTSYQAKFYSRSHDAVIRVYDQAGKVIETHEHAGEFKEP
jgi:hypothetical protein